MKRYDDSQLKGWTQLCSDGNWSDYHGMWAKQARDGSWYVLKFDNLVDSMGERDAAEFGATYECQVKRVDFSDLAPDAIASALESCGYELTKEGTIENEYDGGEVCGAEHATLCILECAIGYGLGAPLESFYGNGHPLRVRGKARAYAMAMMRDADELEERLDRPVNAIMTSARDYGSGRPLLSFVKVAT